MAKTKTTLNSLATSIDDLAQGLKMLKTELYKGFDKVNKKFEETDTAIENLALSTKQGFDNVDFKFVVIDDRLKELQKSDQKLETKIDRVHDEVIKNGDAFGQLKNYVDAEISAVRGHLLRVDEKIGLA